MVQEVKIVLVLERERDLEKDLLAERNQGGTDQEVEIGTIENAVENEIVIMMIATEKKTEIVIGIGNIAAVDIK